MPQPTEVYVKIEPFSKTIDTGASYIRVVLPYGRDTTPADVRVTWGRVRASLAKALRVARHEGETPLPNHLEGRLGITHEVPTALIEDPRVDLMALIESDLQQTVIAALTSREKDRRN